MLSPLAHCPQALGELLQNGTPASVPVTATRQETNLGVNVSLPHMLPTCAQGRPRHRKLLGPGVLPARPRAQHPPTAPQT